MARRATMEQIENKPGGVGFLGYLMIAMWFLLTILASTSVQAEEAVALKASDILPDIEAALTANGMPNGAEIALNDPDETFALNGEVEFAHVSYNAQSGRFVMRLAGTPATIAGVARLSESFPILNRPIERGDTIQEADIAYTESADLRAGTFIQNADDLIGKEARRPLPARTPIRSSDVVAPVLVKRGALVTVTYVMQGLRLTNQGVAMASGAQGDVVTIKNVQSDRLLKGVVDGENLVRIASPRANLPQQES